MQDSCRRPTIITSASISTFNTNSGSVSLRLRFRCADGREATAFRTIYIDDNSPDFPGGPIPIVRAPADPTELLLSSTFVNAGEPITVIVPQRYDQEDGASLLVTELATGRVLERVPLRGQRAYRLTGGNAPAGAHAVHITSAALAPKRFTVVQ